MPAPLGLLVLAQALLGMCSFFFFSSRRRHTRLVSDWSSDVCSSDLVERARSASSRRLRRRDRSMHASGNRARSRSAEGCGLLEEISIGGTVRRNRASSLLQGAARAPAVAPALDRRHAAPTLRTTE